MKICLVEGCGREAKASRGWCWRHYNSYRKYGDPLAVKRSQDNQTIKYRAEYQAYADMKDRCNNPNNKFYKDYGGRGIKVCPRWKGGNDFYNFLGDMGRLVHPSRE